MDENLLNFSDDNNQENIPPPEKFDKFCSPIDRTAKQKHRSSKRSFSLDNRALQHKKRNTEKESKVGLEKLSTSTNSLLPVSHKVKTFGQTHIEKRKLNSHFENNFEMDNRGLFIVEKQLDDEKSLTCPINTAANEELNFNKLEITMENGEKVSEDKLPHNNSPASPQYNPSQLLLHLVQIVQLENKSRQADFPKNFFQKQPCEPTAENLQKAINRDSLAFGMKEAAQQLNLSDDNIKMMQMQGIKPEAGAIDSNRPEVSYAGAYRPVLQASQEVRVFIAY